MGGLSEPEDGMNAANQLCALLTRSTGIELTRGGLLAALLSYLENRTAELGLPSFEAYVQLVEQQDAEELERLIDIISVPHTWFFRDLAQLEALRTVLEGKGRGRELRAWVPGCATGEDAYSIALIAESLALPVRVCASDLSTRSLEQARRAHYSDFSLRDLPSIYHPLFTRKEGGWEPVDSVRRRVEFIHHNLMGPALSAPEGWDVILCRNVLIYFSTATGTECAARLGAALHPGGFAFFGAGELIHRQPPGLSPVLIGDRVAFRRNLAGLASPPGTRPPGLATRPERLASPVPPTEPRGATVRKAPPPAAQHPTPARDDSQPDLLETTTEPWFSERDFFEREDFEGRAREVVAASARSPFNAPLRMMSGIALYTAGDLSGSLRELRACLTLDDRLWPAAVYKGLCLDSMGNPEQARGEYRHAVRVAETEPHALPALPAALEGLTVDLHALARKRAG